VILQTKQTNKQTNKNENKEKEEEEEEEGTNILLFLINTDQLL
jgi:hypothetical protein